MTDTQIVSALVVHLDERITLSHLRAAGDVQPTLGHECAVLLQLIAERPYPVQPKGRPSAIRAVLNSLPPIGNERDVRSLLSVALVLSGDTTEAEGVTAAIEGGSLPKEIVALALGKLDRPSLIRLLPRLQDLVADDWSYLDWPKREDRGRRVYPLRQQAYACLTSLGIHCRVIEDEVELTGPKRRAVTEARIDVDRSSLSAKLRTWLLDSDERTWRSALRAAQEMRDQEVSVMLHELLRDSSLPISKKEALHRLLDSSR